MKTTQLAALALVLFGAEACVNTPLHNEYVDPTDGTLHFDGVAQGASRRIDVQARRKDNGQWVTLAVTGSGRSCNRIWGSDCGYSYATDVDVDAYPDWRCFYTAECTIPFGTLSAQFRVREQYSPLITLTRPEAQCLSDRFFNSNDTVEQAYDRCAGSQRRTLTLYWHRPFTFPGDPPGKL